jgi:RNA polymerase sigma-70 factor (ECF subfamily)
MAMSGRSGKRYLLLADEDLMSLTAEGDSNAFASLYDRHGRAAYSLAYRMVGERGAAEDLVQEAFLEAWRASRSYRAQRGSVRTWLLSIVHNRGIDQLRASASRRRTRERYEAEAERSAPGSGAGEAFNEAWRNSQRDRVREALRELPPDQLKVLELAYFSGYTHVEISELLDVPLGTVKGRMRLGLKKIRDHFGAMGEEVPL